MPRSSPGGSNSHSFRGWLPCALRLPRCHRKFPMETVTGSCSQIGSAEPIKDVGLYSVAAVVLRLLRAENVKTLMRQTPDCRNTVESANLRISQVWTTSYVHLSSRISSPRRHMTLLASESKTRCSHCFHTYLHTRVLCDLLRH
jgi:hypothetical protein